MDHTMTPYMKELAAAFVHDIFVSAGIAKNKRPIDVWANGGVDYAGLSSACKRIADCIIDGKFENVDDAIEKITKFHFNDKLTTTNPSEGYVKINITLACELLAYFCAAKKFYWDDSDLSPEEIKFGPVGEFMGTYLGHALSRFGCFTSQDTIDLAKVELLGDMTDDSKKSSTTAATPTTATPTAAPKKITSKSASWYKGGKVGKKEVKPKGAMPKDDYKSTGGHAHETNGIKSLSKAGIPAASTIWLIQAEGKKAARDMYQLHIKPLQGAKYWTAGGKNKVFFGAGLAYKDCILYWPTEAEALAFLDRIAAADRIPSDVSAVSVVHTAAHKRGGHSPVVKDDDGTVISGGYRDYFWVETEFGDALISAHKLNEANELEIEEDLYEGRDYARPENIQDTIKDLDSYEKYWNAD